MGTHVLVDAAVWMQGVAVHDVAHTLQFATARDAKDRTVFGNTARRNKVGLFTSALSVSGYTEMDGYDEDLFELYSNAPTTPVSLTATGVDGDPAYTLRSLVATLTPLSGTVGDIAAVSLEAAGRGGVKPVRGTILHPETARSASGVGVGRQLGAVEASEAVYGALHVVSASGVAPTLDVIVESDDNAGFTTPTTRLTFAQATGQTGDWQSLAGPITDEYWRISYTVGGATPEFTFAAVVGIAST